MSSTFSIHVYRRPHSGRIWDQSADSDHFRTRADLQAHLLGLIDDETITHMTIIEDADGNPNHRILKMRPEVFHFPNRTQERERDRWADLTQLLGSNAIELALAAKFA